MQDAPLDEIGRTRPAIESSWTRSRLHGVRRDTAPRLVQGPVDPESGLSRAAGWVLERARQEFDGFPAVFLLADRTASVIDMRYTHRSIDDAMTNLGLAPGVRVEERQIGTNGLGTALQTGRSVLVRGPEHFVKVFDPFSCFGHPIVHPVTRRLEGAVNLACAWGQEHPLLPSLIRHLVQDIEDRLLRESPLAQRRMLAAFQAATRSRGRAVMVLGPGLVLAGPSALDLIQAADHPAVEACVDPTGPARERVHQLTLASGRSVRLRCVPIEDTDGVLVDIVPERNGRRGRPHPDVAAQWPLLVIGEPGSGRTTEARRAAGPGATVLDATAAARRGEASWAAALGALLKTDGPAAVVENIESLSEPLTMLVAKSLTGTTREVVLTSTPGEHLQGVHAPLVAMCAARRDLVPLRRRRHEIPHLAQRMLAQASGSARVRLTSETLRVLAAQSWPGNLAELRRAVDGLARIRSAGDILPSDLPASQRDQSSSASPFRQAEREVIVATIDAANGNRREAARALGVSRSTLYNRMRALHIH
ncbi:helix-turn-helix domain-containing protein [Embleya sp. MST-111070]|uniref:helix-turn-helix domain-containing protein n=1 Tax=Embleya sp. MST-111070 TaxID=3398231 RepID=UPI003F73687F